MASEPIETNRNYEEIDRPYDGTLSRSPASTDNGSVETQPVKSDGAMDDIWIKNFIRSENWHPKTVGFYIDGRTGYAEFSNVFVSGDINAVTGSIGGFDIGPDYIRDSIDSFGLSSEVTENDDVRFWAGDTFARRSLAEFRVYESGALFATNATITGTITGSTINGSTITGGTIQTATSGLRLRMQGTPSSEYQFLNNDTEIGNLNIAEDGTGGYQASIQIDPVAGGSGTLLTVGVGIGASTEVPFFNAPFISASGRAAVGSVLLGPDTDLGAGIYQVGLEWSGGDGILSWTFLAGDTLVKISSDITPDADNTYKLGSVTGSNQRWSDVRSVLINGADIGFENGWKFREYPAKKEDVGKPVEWMRENANLGIQLLDENENLIAVFHKNGHIYCNGVKSLSELSLLD